MSDKNLIKADYLSGMKLKDIIHNHDIPMNTLKSWIKRYKWSEEKKKGAPVKRKRGAPLNNRNAAGNSGGAAPLANKNAEKHGFHSKWLPKETQDIIKGMREKQPLDIMWEQIEIQYAAIIRSQQIMYVKDQKDKTIEKIEEKDGNIMGERWEVQQAWDKQATFLKAQSRAIAELRNMIKDYLELEGANKRDAKENAQDWKSAIIEIAKKRAEDG